jgi:hypothetical protein
MRTKLVIAAVATAAAVSAVGASAFTASITGDVDSSRAVGYAATTITDADFASYPVFTYSAGLDTITQIDVVLTGDTSGSTLSVNRNGAAPVTCGAGVHTTNTAYSCTVNFAVTGMTAIGYLVH